MQAIETFRIQPLDDGEHSRLLLPEGPVAEIDGVALEGQFRCSRGYLVITSDDVPHEEMLHFYFLSDAGEILDQLSLGQIYTPGILRNMVAHADDRLDFSFFGTERWTLTILAKPVTQPLRLFSSVKRKGWFRSHYLRLEKT
jgi:hypothetical protein